MLDLGNSEWVIFSFGEVLCIYHNRLSVSYLVVHQEVSLLSNSNISTPNQISIPIY